MITSERDTARNIVDYDEGTLRSRFPILETKAYLNSCSQGPLSTDVTEAYARYLDDWNEKGGPWDLWVEMVEATRREFAGLLGAEPEEVAVTPAVSVGVASLASALRFEGTPRNRVVLSDFEFPTIGQIWHAQEQRGATVVHVPAAGDDVPVELFEEAIDENTALVSITHVCFRNGSKLDVKAIADIAHRNGALVLVDGYQAIGSMPVDVRELGIDFYTGGTLKYLLGSAGLAFLYVRKDLIENLVPTSMGWFSQSDIFAMDIHANTPSSTASRFESGTPPVPSLYAGLAGVRLVRSIGLDTVEAKIAELTHLIKQGARERELRLVSPMDAARHGALMTLQCTDAAMLRSNLMEEGIVTSYRNEVLRVSPHFFNEASDVERLFEGLDRHRQLLVSE